MEDFWFLFGVGCLVIMCCAGRALVIYTRGKYSPKQKSPSEEEED